MSDDNTQFEDFLDNIRPLKQKNVIHRPSARSVFKQKNKNTQYPVTNREIESAQNDFLVDTLNADVLPSDTLSYMRSGLQYSAFKKLKQGRMTISSHLDLHGYIKDQARVALVQFITQASQSGCRCVLIIHGKGMRSPDQQAILKTQVAHWLTQFEEVLAFHSAQPKDGGVGAVYVLLTRQST